MHHYCGAPVTRYSTPRERLRVIHCDVTYGEDPYYILITTAEPYMSVMTVVVRSCIVDRKIGDTIGAFLYIPNDTFERIFL